MSIFTALRDAVLGTTPQAVVAKRLQRIEAVEADWAYLDDFFTKRGLWNPDGSPVEKNRCAEAAVEIRNRKRARDIALGFVDEGFEGSAVGNGERSGGFELRARCRIKEVRW